MARWRDGFGRVPDFETASRLRAFAPSWLCVRAMSQFPRNFIDDLRLHADIVSVVGDVVSLKKMGATLEGPVPVPQREDAVVSRQPREGVLPLLRVQHGRRRHQVRRAAREGRLPRSGADAGSPFRAGHSRRLRGARREHQRRGARGAAEGARRGRRLVSAAAGRTGRRPDAAAAGVARHQARKPASCSGWVARRQRATG